MLESLGAGTHGFEITYTASGRVADIGFGAANVLFQFRDLALEMFGVGKLNFIQRLILYGSVRLVMWV